MCATGRCGFSLVELLIVILMVSMLAAMLLPTIERSFMTAEVAHCGNTQRQLGCSNAIYASESADWMPTVASGNGLLFTAINRGVDKTVAEGFADWNQPSYFWELWPDEVRWCPSLRGRGENVPWALKLEWDKLHGWGYSTPVLDNEYLTAFMYGRIAEGVAAPRTSGYVSVAGRYQYVRPFRPQPGRFAFSTPLFGGLEKGESFSFDPARTLPFASCYFADMPFDAKATPHGWVPAFASGERPGFAEGTNSLWMDGHVEWNRYDSLLTPKAWSYGATPEDGWYRFNYPASKKGWFWCKRPQ